MRDVSPFRFAMPDALRDLERRIGALERRDAPLADTAAAAPRQAWKVSKLGYSLATGGVGTLIDFDTFIGAESNTTVTPSSAIGLSSGVWVFEAWAQFAPNVTGQRIVFPQIDGASSGRRAQVNATLGGITTEIGVAFTETVPLGGATVGVVAAQTSGGNLSTSVRLSAVRVGDL